MSKLYTLLLTLAALAICTSAKDFEKECKELTHISNEDEFNYNKAFTDSTIEVPQNFKCYTDCVLRNILSKVDDKYIAVIDPHKDLAENPSEQAVQIAKQCNESVERFKDDCEYAFKFMSCIKQKS